MKKKRMIRVFMLMTVCSLGFQSCDKEDNSIAEPDDPTRNYQETTLTDTTLTDSIEIDFKLLDMDGKETTTFAYGDNITFSLSLTNISSQAIEMPYKNPWNAWDDNLFQVFAEDGQNLGKPWDLYLVHLIEPLQPFKYEPGYEFNCCCKWKGILIEMEDELESHLIDTFTGVPILSDVISANEFYQQQEREFLPVGEYYCQFEITLGKNDQRTCHVDFRIVENPDVQQGDTINPILEGKVYDSIKEFFNNHYGQETGFRSFFDHSDKSKCLVINSTEELKNHYLDNYPFPEVDFDKYTLIVGQKIMSEAYYTVLRQELISFDDELRLNVYVPKLDGAYTAFQNLFYWGLYPKVKSSNITVKLFKE